MEAASRVHSSAPSVCHPLGAGRVALLEHRDADTSHRKLQQSTARGGGFREHLQHPPKVYAQGAEPEIPTES
jgi:hypothetical protein